MGRAPARVESIAWVSERRKDVLSVFFGLAAMLAYVSWVHVPGRIRYGLVLLLYALSLMAKPMLVTLPFLLLLLDYWPLGRLRLEGGVANKVPIAPSKWGLLLEKLPLFVLSCAHVQCGHVSRAAKGSGRETLDLFPWQARISTRPRFLHCYLG